MKTILTLFAAAIMFSLVNLNVCFANHKTIVTQEKSNPIKHLEEKKLQIGVHKQGNVKIGHKGTDYVLFSSDGNYTQEWSGIESKGTWYYDATKNSIVVKLKNENTWIIKEVTNDKIILEKGKEIISLFTTTSSK